VAGMETPAGGADGRVTGLPTAGYSALPTTLSLSLIWLPR